MQNRLAKIGIFYWLVCMSSFLKSVLLDIGEFT